MRTATVLLMATLTWASGSSAVSGEQRSPGQKQETPRSLSPASKGWPEQWSQRKLHRDDHAFIYAQKKSTAEETARTLQAIVAEARQDGVTNPAAGLIVVVDAQEKVSGYRQKLGLDESKPPADKEPAKAQQEAGPGSG